MITREQGIRTWASRWVGLKAWGRNLAKVTIEVSDRMHNNRLGTCWTHQQRIVIYRGDSFVDELGTLLHELAHAAAIDADHSEKWQTVFAAAVSEATGVPVVPCANNYRILNQGNEVVTFAFRPVS